MTAYGHALAMAGQFITFSRNFSTVNKQKVENFILLLNREFQPELQPNSEQKAHVYSFSPAVANALVACMCFSVTSFLFIIVNLSKKHVSIVIRFKDIVKLFVSTIKCWRIPYYVVDCCVALNFPQSRWSVSIHDFLLNTFNNCVFICHVKNNAVCRCNRKPIMVILPFSICPTKKVCVNAVFSNNVSFF